MEKITRQEALEIAVERIVDAWDMDDLIRLAFDTILEEYTDSCEERQDELFEDAMLNDDYIIE